MIFWILAAFLTAIITVWVVTPLMKNALWQRIGWVIVVILPIITLGLYSLLGQPALAIYSYQ